MVVNLIKHECKEIKIEDFFLFVTRSQILRV